MRSSVGNSSDIPICWSFLRSRNYCPSAKRAVQSYPRNPTKRMKNVAQSLLSLFWAVHCNCGCVHSRVCPVILPYFHNSFHPERSVELIAATVILSSLRWCTHVCLIKGFFHRPTIHWHERIMPFTTSRECHSRAVPEISLSEKHSSCAPPRPTHSFWVCVCDQNISFLSPSSPQTMKAGLG